MNLEVETTTEPASIAGGFWRCKQIWIDAAEVVDSLRVFPRLVLIVYGWWAIHVTDWMVRWYEALPATERNTQVTAVISVIIPGVFGLSAIVFKVYSDGGRDWDKPK